MDELDEPRLLRKYLLGMLEDEVVLARLEERLMVDEEFVVRIAAAEDELIEEFLDGELTPEESDRFNRFFLAPPERKRQLRLTRDLRRVSASKATADAYLASRSSDSSFSFGWLRFALVAGAVLVAVLGVWRFAFFTSDTDRGLDQLRAAYRDSRPVESRITQFPSYAPYSETRSGEKAKVSDPSALEGANRYLIDATRGSDDAAAHHALGVFHLAAGDLEAAEREIQIALEASPKDARIQSDAGALYIEKARDADKRDDKATKLILLNESLKHLDLAISLDAKLQDAYFNRALCLQMAGNTEQAKAAWRQYLELDPNSSWSEDAKRKLQELERPTAVERSGAEIEDDFLNAFRARNETDAGRLVGGSRELIREKYLPQRLAISYLAASGERRDELLDALRFAGEIEMRLTGDPLANEIAFFYSSLTSQQSNAIQEAHEKIREAYRLTQQHHYGAALPLFREAKNLFDSSKNGPESKLAEYCVAYCLINENRSAEALPLLAHLEKASEQNRYEWLRATVLYWIGGSHLKLGQPARAEQAYRKAVLIADRIGDSFVMRRNLAAMADIYSTSGQYRDALACIARVFETTGPTSTSPQRYRDISQAFKVVMSAGLFNLAKPLALEAIRMSDELKDEMWMAQSRVYGSIALARLSDLDAARSVLQEGHEKAESIVDEASRNKAVALSNLYFGEFERLTGNPHQAERHYVDAAQYYDSSDLPWDRESTQLGLLLAYMEQRKLNELEKQIPVNIQLVEDYRAQLDEEQQRIGFFDLRQNIYDIAAQFELGRGKPELAYDYVERSSSRALLDRMQSGTSGEDRRENSAVPRTLQEIRAQIPANVQILQYSVFPDSVVIWVVSRDRFDSVSVPIPSTELVAKVAEFAKLIGRPGEDPSEATLSRELYDVLIRPVRERLRSDAEICLIPSKVLFEVPFGALLSPERRRFVTDHQLLYAPSANVFVTATKTADDLGSSSEETLLAIGDPAFDTEQHKNLARLRHAEAEVVDIAKMYADSVTLIRDAATKESLIAKLPNTSVVHFAGHYVVVPRSPMMSHLLLATNKADGKGEMLTGTELEKLSLPKTRLIVLAACDTGAESIVNGEGVMGMSRSVLASKVPLVVASQWSVDSAATTELMVRFHSYRTGSRMSTVAALRQAQNDLINEPTGRFSSPYYWAAFAVYGGNADF